MQQKSGGGVAQLLKIFAGYQKVVGSSILVEKEPWYTHISSFIVLALRVQKKKKKKSSGILLYCEHPDAAHAADSTV